MARLVSCLIGLALAACAAEPTGMPTGSPMPSRSAGPSASEGQSVSDLLDCDGPISDSGGAGEAIALDIAAGGASPDETLDAFLAQSPFMVPIAGYEPLATSGDRYAYGYRTGGEVKVVVVVSPRFGKVLGTAYAVDELRMCSDDEFGAGAVFRDGRRVWAHEETGEILTDFVAPAHCEWQSARMLHVPGGDSFRQYLRDPQRVFDFAPLLDTYAEGVELPDDASDSGYRSSDGLELWFTESDTAAYVVTPDGIERWPRAEEPVGCA